jgi:hypothetical protein
MKTKKLTVRETTRTKKTIEDWLRELPPDLAALALTAWKKERDPKWAKLGVTISSLRMAVGYSFCWEDTVQGGDFWEKVANGRYPEARRMLQRRVAVPYSWTTAKPAKPGNYVLRPQGKNDLLQLVRVAKSHGGFRIYFRTEEDGTTHYEPMSSLPKNFWEWLEIPE